MTEYLSQFSFPPLIGANQKKTDYICISKESEGPAPDTLDETLPYPLYKTISYLLPYFFKELISKK